MTVRRGTARLAATFAVILATGCIYRVAPAPAPPSWGCVVLALSESPDSLYLAMYRPPCDRTADAAPDTIVAWRIPSRHRECILYAKADVTARNLETSWMACRVWRRS